VQPAAIVNATKAIIAERALARVADPEYSRRIDTLTLLSSDQL
jgi:hypothetical protein